MESTVFTGCFGGSDRSGSAAMEKEAGMLKKEMKNSIPVYKLCYSLSFVLILCLVRGIAYTAEIGIAIEPPAALLSIVFCADTYLMEVQGKRREVFRLYALKKQIKVIYRRMIVQILYLFGIFTVGYGLFYWQRPIEGPAGSSLEFFVSFLWAIGGTILFWGILSVAVSILVGKQWLGIGVTAVLWFLLFSKAADEFLGKWSVFSYTFRNINTGDAGWIWGKAISVFLALLLAALLPLLLKKKG